MQEAPELGEEDDDLGGTEGPPYRRKQKERLVKPAIGDNFCQLKLNSRTGVWPISARVRTRWGCSERPL